MAEKAGLVGMARIQQNPFAIKTTTPTRSVADSTENKESKPIVAPPTLVLGAEGACAVSSSGSKIVLRPSALAFQAEKLKQSSSALDSSTEGQRQRTTFRPADLPSNPRNRNVFDRTQRGGTPQLFGRRNYDDVSSDSSVPSSTELTFQQMQAGQSVASSDQPTDLTSPDAKRRLMLAVNFATRLSANDSNAAHIAERPGSSRQGAKSLSESAEEYQSRQVKRRYNEVTVVTGEENESNVLQINCKLFTFDKVTGSWQERGRGNLRLNDQEVDGVLQSRLVMRTQGSLRVILNTKVWSGMVVEHPSSKTVRTSAIDPDGIRVYLIQLSADSSSYADGTSLEDDSDGPCSKKARLLMHPEQGNLPDSSRSEDSASPGVPAECESSGEDNKG
ncbi:ran-binding protein (RanBP), putative [Ixodes scapularis]|uniref:Ran-binding protein (RanBP), putative n=1 Tax=Ixodes scapularis TaxID=6945 RepID=B7Q0T1_IXOSC|nr:ran-binding protein (RanBP), putative [Ixodes scapularis]|eukprot:XP_002408292.1 ran-binding protein (RanBP), putative [Ixodes scapularis]